MKRTFLFVCLLLVLNTISAQVEMELLASWSDPTLPASTAHNNTYNEVWGFEVNEHEYAVIGSTMGTHIIDVTDPGNIFIREFIAGASQGTHIIHRDYHDYAGYLYAVADEDTQDNPSTLQIIDISGLPDDISVVYDDNDLIERVHNIFIDEEAGKLYALAAKGGDSGYKAMKIYTLDNPIDPKKIGQYGVIGGESFGHVHDAYVVNDTAFMNCGGDGLFIVDFSGDDPVLIDRYSTLDYPESGYNHSGWLSEDKEHYYFADETHGTSLKVVKMNGFQGIELGDNLFNAGNESDFSIAHNEIVHCGRLYVSYYYDGLQVYDLEDPENPERVAHYPTSNIDPRGQYEGSWGVYPFLPSGNIIVSDMQEGFFLLKGLDNGCNSPVNTDQEQLLGDFQLFPNPSNGHITIETAGNILAVTVFDLQGRVVWTESNVTNNLELPIHIVNGMYTIQVQLDSYTVNKKIIIQH